MTKQLTVTLLAAVLLAGCGTSLTATATGDATTAALRGLSADGTATPGGKGGRGGPGGERGGPKGGHGPLGLFADLDLTDEQKAQIQAIEEKYRLAPPEGDAAVKGEKPVDNVAAVLKAETLDVDALKAAIAERESKAPPAHPDHAAMLTEIRAVLTDAQIQAIVAKLQAVPADKPADAPTDRPSPPTVDERVAQVAEKAQLTDAQKAAFLAFETKMDANRPAPPAEGDHAARQAAELAFWQTGDASGLTPPTAVERPAFPVDEFVALAQALSAEQRAQLLARGPGGMGHGGPGGPGMGGERGGKGGPMGHGGPGGFGGRGDRPAPDAQAAAQ